MMTPPPFTGCLLQGLNEGVLCKAPGTPRGHGTIVKLIPLSFSSESNNHREFKTTVVNWQLTVKSDSPGMPLFGVRHVLSKSELVKIGTEIKIWISGFS